MSMFVKTANKGSLNLRAQPSTSSAVLANIPYGTELAAESYNDEWSKVSYKERTGYVMTKFLVESLETDSKAALQKVYNSLKSTLKTIEEVLK